ncbi:MAG: DNA polymerase IV [Treponema sp.]|nr:DNA polymerase IV [Treponema sp.]
MPCFIHADIDAFYASVEQLDRPECRGKPVIVGGLPGDRRSVVSAASYEARRFGVRSAMPVAQAARLCPDGIFLRGNMGRYREKSDEIMAIFGGFSPEVRQISIDEAFIDVTGTEGLFGPPEAVARSVKRRVAGEAGLTVSVGVSSNRYLAKIASGMSKPDGLCVIPPGGEEAFMRALPAEKIWGTGDATHGLFRKHGIRTGDDLFRLSPGALASLFGKAKGRFLYRAVRGEGAAFEEERETRSISTERTFAFDLHDEFAMESVLFDLCQSLLWRLLEGKWQSRTVSVKIRYGDFSTEGARESRSGHVATLNDLYDRLLGLFRKKYRRGRGVRLLGAGLMNLEDGAERQGELFGGAEERDRRLEEAILDINKKFPGAALRRGRSWLAEQ